MQTVTLRRNGEDGDEYRTGIELRKGYRRLKKGSTVKKSVVDAAGECTAALLHVWIDSRRAGSGFFQQQWLIL